MKTYELHIGYYSASNFKPYIDPVIFKTVKEAYDYYNEFCNLRKKKRLKGRVRYLLYQLHEFGIDKITFNEETS